MGKTIALFHWLPRIICILAILFVSMFAADSFESGLGLAEQIGHLVMHLIPSFLLIAILIIAWKWEMAGGLLLIFIGGGLTPFIYLHNYEMNHSVLSSLNVVLVINFPFILAGILFLISNFIKKKYS